MLVGCSPSDDDRDLDILDKTQTPQIDTSQEDRIAFTVGDIALEANRPTDWEYYPTDYGVVVAEYLSAVAQEGQLGGLFTHIWVPPLDDFAFPAADTNRAYSILRRIIQTPEYVGASMVSAPYSFEWGDASAAYYLMNNGEGTVTIVFGVIAPTVDELVAASISAPVDQSARIRTEIIDLMDGLTINGVALSGQTLDNILPDPLEYPASAGVSDPQTDVRAPVRPSAPAVGAANTPDETD